jgi:Protein of unknown function (DUF3000)
MIPDGDSRRGRTGASGAARPVATYPANVEPQSLPGGAEPGTANIVEDVPAAFRAAVLALEAYAPRAEITLERIPAPQRLAPFAIALGARIADPDGEEDDEIAAGRFIVLHDPAGHEAWDGTTRCVGYVSASTDEHMVDDAMFSEVAWSWLTDALTEAGASHRAVGGTVTRTASTRFGALAGPEHSVDVEIRASWTAGDDALDRHLAAFLDVLGNAAGLPPPGVHLLGPADRHPSPQPGGGTL